MANHYEHLEKAMCKELDRLDKKYMEDLPEMSVQDVERADILYHALKSAATYYAMKDAEGYDEDDMEGSRSGRSSYGRGGQGRSYARGRDSMGRYASRDMEGYSGHYPEWMPPYYGRY